MKSVVGIIIVFSLTVLDFSCAVRRSHGGDEAPGSQEGLTPSEEGVLSGLERRPLVDVNTLAAPGAKLSGQNVCSVGSTSDQVLRIQVHPESPYDSFRARLCVEGEMGQCTETGGFLDPNYLVHAPAPGTYDVQVRGCLDANHAKDPKNLCGNWYSVGTYNFTELSPQAQNRMNQRSSLRDQMTAVCKAIERDMRTFVKQEKDPANKLKPMVVHDLAIVGNDTCRELLLSPELAVINDLADLLNSTKQTPGIEIVINNQSFVMAYILMAGGILGTAASGYQAYQTFQKTVTKKAREYANEILQLERKQRILQVMEYKEQIDLKQKTLDFLDEKGEKPDVSVDTSLEDNEREIKALITEIETKHKVDLSIKDYLTNPDPDKVWNEYYAKIPSKKGWFGSKMGVKPGDPKGWTDTAVAYIVESPFVKLYNKIQMRDFLLKSQKDLEPPILPKEGESEEEKAKRRQQEEVERGVKKIRLQVEIEHLKGLKEATEEGWKKSLEKVVRDAAMGAAIGGAAGGVLGHWFTLGTGTLAGVGYGAAVGGVAGGANSAIEEYKKINEDVWSLQDKIDLATKPVETRKRLVSEVAKEIKAAQANREEEANKTLASEKWRAAAPWMILSATAASAVAVGGYQAFNLTSDAQDLFLESFQADYKRGLELQQKYANVNFDLLFGSCGK